MKKLIISLAIIILTFNTANAAMVKNDSIGNDPTKEKICASRAKGKVIPFEIDSHYLNKARSMHPDATFIAIDGISPQLIECYLREGTGKYEPDSMSPEQSYWHTIKPQGFSPGINSDKGQAMAAKVCLNAFLAKINRAGLDHSVSNTIFEINLDRAGTLFAGEKAERYDIAVKGTSFYGPAQPDLTAVGFSCLLSPSLKLKAVQYK